MGKLILTLSYTFINNDLLKKILNIINLFFLNICFLNIINLLDINFKYHKFG